MVGFQGVHLFIESVKLKSSYISREVGSAAQMTFKDIIGESPAIINAIRIAKSIAQSEKNVLILGESGVGKGVFARAIHSASARRDGPFVSLNCAAIPRELIASELFGYADGAFTGAKKGGNMGKFELADTGTIFLDEIGDMPLDLQAVLLEVIDQKSFMRIGSNVRRRIDVKIIAATNTNLLRKITEKKFREDLYYRLSTLRIVIPPLRERGDDILVLADHFIEKAAQEEKMGQKPILSEEAKSLLKSLAWAGNVRELQNAIVGALVLHNESVLLPEYFMDYMETNSGRTANAAAFTNTVSITVKEPRIENYRGFLKSSPEMTKDYLEELLVQNRYNKASTAAQLGVSRKTLYRWIERLGI
jgi:transcriptional regulator with PAS, ATPase and Fis domain